MTQTSDGRVTTAARRRSLPVLDLSGLERRLQAAVRGEVRFDAASRAMYANDGSDFRQVPIGVVIPRTLDDIVATHRVCAGFGAPLVNRGGGTSLSGETARGRPDRGDRGRRRAQGRALRPAA